MDLDKTLTSILGHAGRARLKLNAAATAQAEALTHLNGIYRLIHEIQTGQTITDDARIDEPVSPRQKHPEWFKGLNLSSDGRSYLHSRLEAGDGGGLIARQMGISPSAVTKYRKVWLRQLTEQPR